MCSVALLPAARLRDARDAVMCDVATVTGSCEVHVKGEHSLTWRKSLIVDRKYDISSEKSLEGSTQKDTLKSVKLTFGQIQWYKEGNKTFSSV